MKKILSTFLILISINAWSIEYFRGVNGKIVKIDSLDYKLCKKVIYRKSGHEQLPKKHHKRFVKAVLKGELINNFSAVKQFLKKNDNVCTYASMNEILEVNNKSFNYNLGMN